MSCIEHHYELQISDIYHNTKFTFPDFPELDILYVESMNSLCPSNYRSGIVCIWQGNITCTLSIAHTTMVFDTLREEPNIYETDTNVYYFTQHGSHIEHDITYLRITVKKCPKIKNYPNTQHDINTLTYKVGQQFTITKDSNASTGYSWQIQTSPGLTYIGKDTKLNCENPGCGATETWKFIGTTIGNYQIRATYSRSWEKEVPEPTIYNVKII